MTANDTVIQSQDYSETIRLTKSQIREAYDGNDVASEALVGFLRAMGAKVDGDAYLLPKRLIIHFENFNRK